MAGPRGRLRRCEVEWEEVECRGVGQGDITRVQKPDRPFWEPVQSNHSCLFPTQKQVFWDLRTPVKSEARLEALKQKDRKFGR